MQRHAFAVLLQVTGIDAPGALHSRSGSAILAEADGTAWWHFTPVIPWGLVRPEPGKRRGLDEDGPAPRLIPVWPAARTAGCPCAAACSAQPAQEGIPGLCRADPHPHVHAPDAALPDDDGVEIQLADLREVISKPGDPQQRIRERGGVQ